MRCVSVDVSIICVFNDPEVRRHCLDRSIEDHRDEASVEYVPVDNTQGAFATAGAALNHGAALASGDYLAFVHQDVYLHSLHALQAAARILASDETIGMLGAIGVAPTGKLVGRVRDRVVLLGEPAREPVEVDSLDELLFMVPRRLGRREPLSEAPELSWHAYAVEYGLRMRALGLRVCAVDIPLTHNSLTINLDRLDVAYRAIAKTYPHALPLHTPGGVVSARPPARHRVGVLAAHRWRYRWLRESLLVHAATRSTGPGPCVLSDIRWDVDEVLASEPRSPLAVVNLDAGSSFTDQRPPVLELERRGRPITVTARRTEDLVEELPARRNGTSMLLTNLGVDDLGPIAARLHRDGVPRLLGLTSAIGFWMLVGPAAEAIPQGWRGRRSTPARMPGPTRWASQVCRTARRSVSREHSL